MRGNAAMIEVYTVALINWPVCVFLCIGVFVRLTPKYSTVQLVWFPLRQARTGIGLVA